MSKVSKSLLVIIVIISGLVSLGGLSSIPALAIDASVSINAILDHITVTPENPSITKDTSTQQFTATAFYSNAPEAIVTYSANWTSSNTSVATISLNTGLATIIAEGTTTITAEYEGKSANTTLQVTEGGGEGGGGGGGGGGGSGGGGSNSATTVLTDYMNYDGMIISETAAVSADGQVVLNLPEGTTVKNKNGQPLPYITIKENTEPPEPPANSQFVCLTYDITPNGTTFDPLAFLNLYYRDAQVPAGVAEENMVFVTLQDGIWVELEGAVIDTVNNVVTVPISHLSLYTVVAYTSPARFEVTDMTVNPVEVYPYDEISVSATITNTGDLSGSFEATLTIDNEVVRNQIKTLKGGDSETIVFTIVTGIVGEHRVGLGNNVATFVVRKPLAAAVFAVSELSINPTSINSGDKVHVSLLIKNTGDLSGTYPITIYVDDEPVETREVTLDGGSNMTLSFSFFADAVGEHIVNIGDLLGVFEVKSSSSPPAIPELPNLELKGFSTTPNYDEITNNLVSVRIEYQMNQSWLFDPDARLMMTVLYNGEPLEQTPLFTLGQLIDDGKTGELNYVPSAGWMAGEYTFQVELYDGENILQDTLSHSLVVTPEAVIKVVSWWPLGAIIGIAIILISVLLAVIVYFRRDMLRNRVKIIRYIEILR